MDKSPDAFRTISEVAEHLETPAHVLRFWESRFPQIRPVKRAGGRRYYRPSDVSLLTGIKRLLHDEGMTIRGVQKILREQGVRHVAGLSGDAALDDGADDSQLVDHVIAATAATEAEPLPFRPAPGLADAMAKAVDRGPPTALHGPAPSTPLPFVTAAEEPLAGLAPTEAAAQGTLLLTPVVRAEDATGIVTDSASDHTPVEANASDSIKEGQLPLQVALPAGVNRADHAASAIPESVADDSDLDEDDLDGGPLVTVAMRIRALPGGASAAKVSADLLVAVARLRALRDAMANAPDGRRA